MTLKSRRVTKKPFKHRQPVYKKPPDYDWSFLTGFLHQRLVGALQRTQLLQFVKFVGLVGCDACSDLFNALINEVMNWQLSHLIDTTDLLLQKDSPFAK